MKILAVLAVLVSAVVGVACTTLSPKEATPEELQRQPLSGELLKPGDRVRLVKSDESVYEFRVEAIDLEQGVVVGGDKRVPIAELVALETRKVSVGKTVLLVGGVGYSIAAIVLIALAPALILGGA